MEYAVRALHISVLWSSTIHSGQPQEKRVIQHTDVHVFYSRKTPSGPGEREKHQKTAHVTYSPWLEVKLSELKGLQSALFLPRIATCVCLRVCVCVYVCLCVCVCARSCPAVVPLTLCWAVSCSWVLLSRGGRTMGTRLLPGQTAFTLCSGSYFAPSICPGTSDLHSLHSYKPKQVRKTEMTWKEREKSQQCKA